MAADTALLTLLHKARDSAAVPGTAARLLAADTAVARVDAICGEISETVLPRRLIFRIGDAGEIEVDAGGRRLMRVLKVSPTSLAKAGGPAFKERDDAKSADQMTALGALFGTFAGFDGTLTVESRIAQGVYSASAVGFSAERLREAASAASSKASAQVAAPVAPPPAAVADPAGALRAMINKKSQAAAVAPAAAPAPAPVSRGSRGSDETLRVFFNAIEPSVLFAAILNREGNVEAITGKAANEEILACASDIVADLTRWRKYTATEIGPKQIIVLRAGGIQNHSIAYFLDDYGVALGVFANTDLPRIFLAANKAIVPGVGT
jgi:hypothetical protein